MEPNRLHKILHNADGIGDVSLIAFTLIDMVLAIVFFASLAVDTLTTIALCFFGFMASLGKIWARIECEKLKQRVYQVVWAGFTIITFFGGVCFMMTTVQIGSDEPPKPAYVITANDEYSAAVSRLHALEAEQKVFLDKNQRTNAATYDQRIIDQNTLITVKNEAMTVAGKRWETEWRGSNDKIKALSVFNRLPLILSQPSAALIIALLFFSIAFATLETVIYIMAGKIGAEFVPEQRVGRPRGSRNRKEAEPVAHESVKKFVDANWIGLRTNKTRKILSQQSFMEFYSTRGGFQVDEYKRIKQLAIDREVITPGDEILVESEGLAIMRLMGTSRT
jgi:hypothetical protein